MASVDELLLKVVESMILVLYAELSEEDLRNGEGHPVVYVGRKEGESDSRIIALLVKVIAKGGKVGA